MINNILSLFIVVLLVSCSTNFTNDLELLGFNGNIKSIYYDQFENNELISSSKSIYNEDGNINVLLRFDSEYEEGLGYDVTTYNNNDAIGKKVSLVSYNTNDKVISRGEYEGSLFDDGILVLEMFDLNGKLIRKTSFETNTDGMNFKETSYLYGHPESTGKIIMSQKFNKNREIVKLYNEINLPYNKSTDTIIYKCIEYDTLSNCTFYRNDDHKKNKIIKLQYEYY